MNTIWSPADCKTTCWQTEAQAQQSGAKFAAKVGCANVLDVAACLRAAPADTLVEDGGQFLDPSSGGAIGPIVNGTTLTMSASQAFKLGRVNHVKVIIGVGRDEFNGGIYVNSPGHTIVADTTAEYQQMVQQRIRQVRRVGRAAALSGGPVPVPVAVHRLPNGDGRRRQRLPVAAQSYTELARDLPLYVYEDDDADSPGQTLPLGANHSAINRLAHDVPSTLDPNQLALQEQVLAEWTGFARNGVPTVPGSPTWTPFAAPGSPIMSLQAGGDSTTRIGKLDPRRSTTAEGSGTRSTRRHLGHPDPGI